MLSYVLSESLKIDFILQTLNLLIQKHGPYLNDNTIIHSNQDSHYTSIKFRQLLDDFSIRQSMSRRGNCWDNAPLESFFGHMKEELKPYISDWKTLQEEKKLLMIGWITIITNATNGTYQNYLLRNFTVTTLPESILCQNKNLHAQLVN